MTCCTKIPAVVRASPLWGRAFVLRIEPSTGGPV